MMPFLPPSLPARNNTVAAVAIVFAGLLAVVMGGLLARGCYEFFADEVLVVSLDAGNGRHINIYEAGGIQEITTPLSYEAVIGGQIQAPMYNFACIPLEDRARDFRLVGSSAGNVFGVVESSKPKVLLIMHDFSTGDSWPSTNSPGRAADWMLRERLIKSTGDESFVLPEP